MKLQDKWANKKWIIRTAVDIWRWEGYTLQWNGKQLGLKRCWISIPDGPPRALLLAQILQCIEFMDYAGAWTNCLQIMIMKILRPFFIEVCTFRRFRPQKILHSRLFSILHHKHVLKIVHYNHSSLHHDYFFFFSASQKRALMMRANRGR